MSPRHSGRGDCRPTTANQVERLRALIHASQVLAQVESLQDLLKELLQIAQDAAHAEASSFMLHRPATATLQFAMALNDDRKVVQEILRNKIELKVGDGIAGHVAQTRQPLIVNDAYADERFYTKVDKTSGFLTKNLICVPVLYQDELLGVVQVLNSKSKLDFDDEDLALLESFAHLAAMALVRARLLEATRKQERVQVQLETAARIQQNFLPTLPDLGTVAGIWAKTEPAIFVGGDLYDCVPMPDGSHIICVADVSGKGLPAALVGAALMAQIRVKAVQATSLRQLLYNLNLAMFDVIGPEMFATMLVGRFDPSTGRLELANAGHLPPVLARHGVATLLDIPGAPPLGVDPLGSFTQAEFIMQAGDSVLFISDGVTEARNPRRQFFGEERLLTTAGQSGAAPRGPALLDAVVQWRSDAEANDDVTILEVWKR